MKVNRRLQNVKGADMKIFQTPSYDRFCLFEMERKSKDFIGMDGNVAYKNKQIDNVEISNEGRRTLREKLREIKPKVEEPIGYELTIQDTNEVEWEHYTSMREYSGLTLKDGKYNLEDVMKSMMDAYETRYNYIVKEHENGERQVSYNLTGENSLTLDEDLAGLDRAYNKRLANLAGYIVCQQTNDGSKFFQTTNMKKNTAEQKEYIDTAVSMMEKAQKRFLEMREEHVLFPMIKAGNYMMAQMPIRMMEMEHAEHGEHLDVLKSLTNNMTPPADACNTWRALYSGIQEFADDLMMHIHRENNILFPRVIAENH